MKKFWSLLLAYSFLFVYVINAQHAFEHTIEKEAHHNCIQCLQLSKCGPCNTAPTYQIKEVEKKFEEEPLFFENLIVESQEYGNVSKRGPPTLTV